MKHYLIHYVRIHGEFEDGDKFIISAANQDAAIHKAKEILKDDMGSTTDEWEGDTLDCFDYAIELDEVREVPARDARVLERYL